VILHAGPGAPYRWSEPPPEVAGTNVAPAGRTADVVRPGEVWTPDLQATLDLPAAGASVHVTMSPRSTAGLAAPPRGTFADGNVYDVRVGDGLDGVGDGRLLLQTPHQATAVVFSVDGTSWTALDADVVSATEVDVAFQGSGLYLALTDHGSALAGAATAGAGVPLWSVVVLLAVSAAATRSSWRSAAARGRGTPRRSPASR
jgi:hypothetical protein